MDATLLGIFSGRVNAENSIAELSKEGFDARDISLIMKNEGSEPVVNKKLGNHSVTNIAEGAASGVVTGGVLGGLAGLLIGLGAITLPGIGGLLVAGPIAAALGLVGAAATTVSGALTGAVAGGVVGALVGLGLPEEEAKIYENRVKDGGILIAVPIMEDEEEKVRNILAKNGADMIRLVTASRRNYQNYYNPDKYPDTNYPQQNYAYYSDVRPIRKKENLDEYHGNPYSEPIRDDQTEEDVRHTASSLKEKLRKLFS